MKWSPGISLDDVIKQTIFEALEYYGGNKTITAKALDVSIRYIRMYVNERKILEQP